MKQHDMVGDRGNIKARHDWEEDMKLRGNDYKTCGHSHPLYDMDGHYDEVSCDVDGEMCLDRPCPLNQLDIPNPKEVM
jgi:hypothetical protein